MFPVGKIRKYNIMLIMIKLYVAVINQIIIKLLFEK